MLDQRLSSADEEDDAPFFTHVLRTRLAWCAVILLVVVLLVIIPPYISVSRYGRRVATAISAAVGRPVHFDKITVRLLPLPGLTIQNFVVNDLPAFGSEPILRANTVEARLRVSSLWRRRIEVSRISLEEPSINLVRRPDGKGWNLQSILTSASQINSAPTAQRGAGDAPRFPYIEATGARLNFKNGLDKSPFSIRGAEFALWLPEPDQWQLRFEGTPVRTDTDVSDVGLLQVEGSLGRAPDLYSAPIDLNVRWRPTPLGEAAKLTIGYDLGWRGEASGTFALRGKLGESRLVTDIHLLALRRADFVPAHTADVNAHCEGNTTGLLHGIHDLRCTVPTTEDTSVLDELARFTQSAAHVEVAKPGDDAPAATAVQPQARPGVIQFNAEVPSVTEPRTAYFVAEAKGISPNYVLGWLRLFTIRIPRSLTAQGVLSLLASRDADGKLDASVVCDCLLPARPDIRLPGSDRGSAGKPDPADKTPGGEAGKASETADAETAEKASRPENRFIIRLRHSGDDGVSPRDTLGVSVVPAPSNAPATREADPADIFAAFPAEERPAISGEIGFSGYTLRYTSPEAARLAASYLPPLGDGMPGPQTASLESSRQWREAQTWSVAVQPSKPVVRTRHRRAPR